MNELESLKKYNEVLRSLLLEWLTASDRFDLNDWVKRVRAETEDKMLEDESM